MATLTTDDQTTLCLEDWGPRPPVVARDEQRWSEDRPVFVRR